MTPMATLGRFINEDLHGQGHNWFVYCDNNPINSVDPDGKVNVGYEWLEWLTYHIKDSNAWVLGAAFSLGAFALAWVVKNNPDPEVAAAAFVAELVTALSSVACFTYALTLSPGDAVLAVMANGIFPLVVSWLKGEEVAASGAGADSLALPALAGYSTYGIACIAALGVAEIS